MQLCVFVTFLYNNWFGSAKSARQRAMRVTKNKNTTQKFIKVEDFSKKKKKFKNSFEEKKKQRFDLGVLASRMVSKSRHFNRFGL